MQKSNSIYEIIKEYIDHRGGITVAVMAYIIELYAFAQKGITKKDDWDRLISLTEQQALDKLNPPYSNWRDCYNRYNKSTYDVFIKKDEITAKTVRRLNHAFINIKKNYKGMREITLRLHIAIIRVCKDYKISLTNQCYSEFHLGVKTAFYAYRETMIYLRKELAFDLFSKIPDNLTIIKDGNVLKIKELYISINKNNPSAYYQLDPSIEFNEKDLRDIQEKICPYIFKYLYAHKLKLYFVRKRRYI